MIFVPDHPTQTLITRQGIARHAGAIVKPNVLVDRYGSITIGDHLEPGFVGRLEGNDESHPAFHYDGGRYNSCDVITIIPKWEGGLGNGIAARLR